MEKINYRELAQSIYDSCYDLMLDKEESNNGTTYLEYHTQVCLSLVDLDLLEKVLYNFDDVIEVEIEFENDYAITLVFETESEEQ